MVGDREQIPESMESGEEGLNTRIRFDLTLSVLR